MLVRWVFRRAVAICVMVAVLVWVMATIGTSHHAAIIAFVGRFTASDAHHLYLLDVVQRTTIRLTYFYHVNIQPVWSSDGDYLLFTVGGDYNPFTGRMNNTRIFQMNFFTYTQRLLTNNSRTVNEENPSWSPSGRVAYALFRSDNWDIAVMRPASQQVRLVNHVGGGMNTSAHEHTPRWSPDGLHIAYLVGGRFVSELAVADANGRHARMLTSGMQILGDDFDWSPDGAYIVFTAQRDGNKEIYRVNISNGALINLSRRPSDERSPKWSPNGDKIAFISTRNGATRLYTMTTDGVHIQQLTFDDNLPASVVWSPDGEWLIYTAASTHQMYRQLYIISAHGGQPRQLTFSRLDHMSPAWKP